MVMDIKKKRLEIEEENEVINKELNYIENRKRELLNQAVLNNGKLDILDEQLSELKTTVKPVKEK
jgi:hypothetical protein